MTNNYLPYKNLNMYKYGLSVKFKSTEDNGQKLSSVLLKASELVSRAKGCQLYLVSLDADETDTVWTTEIWDSREDHEIPYLL